MKGSQLADALRRVLTDAAPDAPAARLVGLVVDTVLAQPLASLVDADVLTDQLLAALSGPGPASVTADHLEPAFALERARAAASGETLGDAVPASVVAHVGARAGRPVRVPAGAFDGVVEPADVRELLAAALADTIEDVLGRIGFSAAGAGGGPGSGLLGTLARGARAMRDTGTGILGAFGGALQEGVQRQVRALAAQSASALKDRFRDRLRSAEGRVVQDRIRDRLLERILGLRVSDLYAMTDDPGVTEGARWSLEVLSHNLARPEVRDAVRVQIRAALDRVGAREARTFLEDAGLLPALRDAVVAQGTKQAAVLVATDAFGEWLGDLVARAEAAAPPSGRDGGSAAKKAAKSDAAAAGKAARKKKTEGRGEG